MNETKEIMELLNPWWKNEKVDEELTRPYKRKSYEDISKKLKFRQIIVISGLRRVGKTTLIYQIIESLLKNLNACNILYFNFDKRVKELTDIFNAYEELTKINWKREKVYVFLDEVTKLDGWANKIKLIYDAFPQIKFIVSSSGSTRMEEEAIKSLAGRYFFSNVPPLSFKEFLELKKKDKLLQNTALYKKEIQKEFEYYLLRSFPEIIDWKDELLIKDYLRTSIIDKIVKQDLPEKFENIDQNLLLTLLEMFYTEPGIYLDYDGISRKLRISKKTLIQHIYFLEFSYLLRIIRNFRVNIFASSRKLQRAYPYWWTFAYCYSNNQDKIIENLIASSIDAKYYWRKNEKEIDFLKIDGKKILPIEVKNKKELNKTDSKNMKYFLEKFNINIGIMVYNGERQEIKIGRKRIICVPFKNWLLETS